MTFNIKAIKLIWYEIQYLALPAVTGKCWDLEDIL